jgi:hypothetical protein
MCTLTADCNGGIVFAEETINYAAIRYDGDDDGIVQEDTCEMWMMKDNQAPLANVGGATLCKAFGQGIQKSGGCSDGDDDDDDVVCQRIGRAGCVIGMIFYGGGALLVFLAECCAGKQILCFGRLNNDGETCDQRYKGGDDADSVLCVAQFLFSSWGNLIVGLGMTVLATYEFTSC